MRLRIMTIILFFPCCLLDFLFLLIIYLPLWIVCGTKLTSRQPLLEWIFEQSNNKDNEN
jgi:hypothetical protein